MQNLKTMERTEGHKNKVELIVSIFAKVREQPFVLFLILKSNNCFYSVIYVLWSSFV
jgi:hypothetical protein